MDFDRMKHISVYYLPTIDEIEPEIWKLETWQKT